MESPTPPHRRITIGTLIYMCLGFVVIFGGWLLLQYLTQDERTRVIDLPYGTVAEIEEDLGEFSTNATHKVTLTRKGHRSAAFSYFPEEWPLACRFYADADHPEDLSIVEFNPILTSDDPGRWLDADDLHEMPLDDLPDSLVLLDKGTIQ